MAPRCLYATRRPKETALAVMCTTAICTRDDYPKSARKTPQATKKRVVTGNGVSPIALDLLCGVVSNVEDSDEE